MREVLRVGVLAVVLAACSDGGGTTGTMLVLDGGTSPGCTTENGAAACNRIIGAFCARIVQCCAASGTCVEAVRTQSGCVSYFVSRGTDCSAPQYTGTSVCISAAQRCANDIPLIACTDITGGTINLPASCSGF